MLDLLLVTPSSRKSVYQALGDTICALEVPVWSGLIANFIRERGYTVQMLDAEALGLSTKETAERINKLDARLTVFVVYGQQPSASTQCMKSGRDVCELVDGLTMVMGTHASALPEKTINEEPYDFVCEGEGPLTVLGLLEELRTASGDLSKIPGLWMKTVLGAVHSKPAEKIKELDKELPEQAWDLLDMTLYRCHNWHAFSNEGVRQPYVSIQTSLGCPYKCSFCCINAPFGGSGIRYWCPENFINQVEKVYDGRVLNVKIPDEMFVLNEKHVMGICDLIIERGYKLNIWAYARVDTVKLEFLSKMKQAGFNWLCLGIESGSKHVRDGVSKGRFGDTDIEVTVKKIKDAGINIIGNYIFGLPDDTLESMRETLDMAKRLNCEWANFYSAMAYPGSQLYPMAIKNGWRLPSDWIGYSQHSYETLPLPTETLTGSEVLAFRDKAHIEYFTNPDYLSLVKAEFGDIAIKEIEQMLSHEIKRKY